MKTARVRYTSEYTIEVGGLRCQSDGPLRELVQDLAEGGGAWKVYNTRTGELEASSLSGDAIDALNEGSI